MCWSLSSGSCCRLLSCGDENNTAMGWQHKQHAEQSDTQAVCKQRQVSIKNCQGDVQSGVSALLLTPAQALLLFTVAGMCSVMGATLCALPILRAQLCHLHAHCFSNRHTALTQHLSCDCIRANRTHTQQDTGTTKPTCKWSTQTSVAKSRAGGCRSLNTSFFQPQYLLPGT
jgi:hypothetical protein